MRDAAIFLLLTSMLPLAMARPFVGVLLWSWVSFMYPHRIAWSYVTDMPWGMMVALATLVGCVVGREPRRFPPGATGKLIVAFLLMTAITSVLALAHTEAMYSRWSQVSKVFFMALVTLSLLNSRVRVQALIWMIVISVGYYGVKGGAFAIKTGGSYRVWGPAGTLINDNNNLAAAMLTVLPLINYLRQQAADTRVRLVLTVAIGLTTLAVVASQSRGALVGLIAAVGFMWTKTQNKVIGGMAMAVLLGGIAAFMPQSWYNRMHTISTYAESDDTVNNRLYLWETGWRLALARPLTGVGFSGTYEASVVNAYVPGAAARSLHSVWFETLAEHGFPTFFVWLAFPIVAWMNARHLIKVADGVKDLQWGADLARMSQVSIIAFLAAGTFLPLMYYDVYFTIMVALSATRFLVDKQLAESTAGQEARPWRRGIRPTLPRPGLAGGAARGAPNG